MCRTSHASLISYETSLSTEESRIFILLLFYRDQMNPNLLEQKIELIETDLIIKLAKCILFYPQTLWIACVLVLYYQPSHFWEIYLW